MTVSAKMKSINEVDMMELSGESHHVSMFSLCV